MGRRTFDVVFEGGGARGVVLNGALETLEARGHEHRRLVGTSAGAIAASLVAAGFTGAELVAMSRERRADGLPEFAEYVMEPRVPSLVELQNSGIYKALLAAELSLHVPSGIATRLAEGMAPVLGAIPGVRTAFSFVESGGVHSGDGFVQWLTRTLERKKQGLSRATLAELFEETGRHLTILATDTTAARMLVMNHLTTPRVPLVAAVRMSMSIPLFFEEVLWRSEWGPYLGNDVSGHVVVDGGVLSNFPLEFVLPDARELVRTFMGTPPESDVDVLGLQIDPSLEVANAPPSTHSASSPLFAAIGHGRVAQRVLHLVETMLDGNDDTIEQTHQRAICRLPAKSYWATEFHMEPARVDALLDAGRNAMGRHLARLDEESSR